ncbi:DNA-binding MarR family transcriptional regulator [Catenulispora sp. MAP12-49]
MTVSPPGQTRPNKSSLDRPRDQYAYHADTDTFLRGTTFWSWFAPNTVQTFEAGGVYLWGGTEDICVRGAYNLGMERDRILSEIERAWAALLQRRNRAHLYGAMLKAAGLDLDDALYPLLSAVARISPARVADVAEAVGIAHTTASRHLTELEKRGLVKRSPDPSDGRVAIIELTDEGTRAVAAMRGELRRQIGAALADWPDERLAVFARDLAAFAAALGIGPGGPDTGADEQDG